MKAGYGASAVHQWRGSLARVSGAEALRAPRWVNPISVHVVHSVHSFDESPRNSTAEFMVMVEKDMTMTFLLALAGWTLFGLAVLVGLVLDVVGLFGNWVILGATALAWVATGYHHFSGRSLSILVGVALVGEALEMLASAYGAKKFGGGKGAMASALVGCLVGAVVGTPWFPIVGTLVGACLGSFVAATAYEFVLVQKEAPAALWTGLGAALGKVAGLFAKLLAGFGMLLVIALSY